MIIIIFDILLILIKRILNEQKIKDKINIKQSNDSNISKIILNINFIEVFIIKLLIIVDLVNQTKSKDIDSKIFLKVKGIGENTILGNKKDFNFKGINHLKYVYINEKQENSIEYKYYFIQTDNSVELIFDNDLNDCERMFYKCFNIT